MSEHGPTKNIPTPPTTATPAPTLPHPGLHTSLPHKAFAQAPFTKLPHKPFTKLCVYQGGLVHTSCFSITLRNRFRIYLEPNSESMHILFGTDLKPVWHYKNKGSVSCSSD